MGKPMRRIVVASEDISEQAILRAVAPLSCIGGWRQDNECPAIAGAIREPPYRTALLEAVKALADMRPAAGSF